MAAKWRFAQERSMACKLRSFDLKWRQNGASRKSGKFMGRFAQEWLNWGASRKNSHIMWRFAQEWSEKSLIEGGMYRKRRGCPFLLQ